MALRPEFDTPQFKKGLTVRREVLGAEYVDKSVQEVEDFMVPMQKMTTEWCWGEVWTRPLLDRKTRSIMNLCMLTALNRPNEIKLHVLGALNDGVTPARCRKSSCKRASTAVCLRHSTASRSPRRSSTNTRRTRSRAAMIESEDEKREVQCMPLRQTTTAARTRHGFTCPLTVDSTSRAGRSSPQRGRCWCPHCIGARGGSLTSRATWRSVSAVRSDGASGTPIQRTRR